jgi:hypothetical protein
MWDGILDYGKLEWEHSFQKIKKKSTTEANLLEAFDKVWGPHCHNLSLGFATKARACKGAGQK